MALIWVAIGASVSLNNGMYTSDATLLVILASVLIIAFVFVSSVRRLVPDRAGICLAALLVLLLGNWYPEDYGAGQGLRSSLFLSALAATVVLFGALVRVGRSSQRLLLMTTSLLSIGAGISVIRASPKPRIDVWYMYQASSRALLHGANIYTTHWTSGMPHEVSNGFSYLPFSAFLVAPFNWVFGDFRYGLIAATVVAAWLIFRLSTGPYAWALASFVLIFPKVTFGIEQGWNDPVLFALVVLFVFAVSTGYAKWSIIVFVAILTFKQYSLLFLPMAALWPRFGWRRAAIALLGAIGVTLPFAVSATQEFWHSVVSYPFHLPNRVYSLSVAALAQHHDLRVDGLVVILSTLIAIGVSGWRLPHNELGFCAGTLAILVAFVIFNGQVFFNQWELVSYMLVLTTALTRNRAELGMWSEGRTKNDRKKLVS
jgi:hypothetical protein